MAESTDQPVPSEPLDRLRSALGACRPDAGPLRDLVVKRLKTDRRLREDIVESDAPSYEGSMNTLGVFLSTGSWPAKDHGWIEEAVTLARHGNWYSRSERPSYATRADGGDRPGERITLEVLCGSVLVAELARHAAFSSKQDVEPSDGTCLDMIDAARRLGGPWPGALTRYLADHALFGLTNEAWRYDPVLEATREIAVPLTVLAIWRSVAEGAALPVRELAESILALAAERGVERAEWHERVHSIYAGAVGAVRETMVDAVADGLDAETRAAVIPFRKKYLG